MSNLEQFEAAVKQKEVSVICRVWEALADSLQQVIAKCKKYDVKCFVALPRVDRGRKEDTAYLKKYLQSDVDGFLVRAAGQLADVKPSGKQIVTDYNLNVVNRESVLFWKEQGVHNICLSVENNLQEISKMADKDWRNGGIWVFTIDGDTTMSDW